MKIIDTHIHLSHIESFQHTAKNISQVNYTHQGLLDEMYHSGVIHSIGMGLHEMEGGQGFPDKSAVTPMGLDLLKGSCKQISLCAGINPYRLSKGDLHKLERVLLDERTVGIKIYLGYYPFFPYDKVYQPVYELARRYSLPVVFHTGDTYSKRGLLKYSHPLSIDEVAVYHPEVTFILAHLGDPWMLDAAEILYKNDNVYADLSGLIVGSEKEVERICAIPHYFDHFRHALAYGDSYDKLLFGSDWPLVPLIPYINFIKSVIPAEHWEDVFYNNALKVFKKL
ncbi:amidohydrolase family protein [Alkalicoccus daliensis]|uniref:Amidohydrolase-related domain-containing protein n=1 Tax=Alkalicoccus daliensis TaxID=745820 RepID=A0A1H0AEQ5_9BACI|nr:amidohydrolase family protein [Alkalicoccus daliensis]SDN31887.1 hypothetical protein SAMN04488053_101453 [Alkalicoccus daliensis]